MTAGIKLTTTTTTGANADDDVKDESGGVSTPFIFLTAILLPISFPFITAAVLKCHNASTVSKITHLCRTQCNEWASRRKVSRLEWNNYRVFPMKTRRSTKIMILVDPVVTKDLEEGDSIPTANTSDSALNGFIFKEKDVHVKRTRNRCVILSYRKAIVPAYT